jgi:NAD(P)-dependent dehydrogenase (short-subunit alcohol dehydrogenase family)/acyl carrier protein
VSPQKRADIGDWLYAPSWRRSFPFPGGSGTSASATGRKWLIFTDDSGMMERLVSQLAAGAASLVTVVAGTGFVKQGASTYTVEPGSSQDMLALVTDLGRGDSLPDHVLHCWSLTGSRGPRSPEQALDLGYNSICALVQALQKARAQHPIGMTIVTNSLQDVVGDVVFEPARATIFGAALVVGQENPHIVCRTVDVVLPEHGGPADKVLVEQLLEELAAPMDDASVAYRASTRWVRAYEPVRAAPARTDNGLLRDQGVYLITGGLGGIGLVLAEHLARTVRARLVLVGRRSIPPVTDWENVLTDARAGAETVGVVRKLRSLRELGADVMVVQADVADRDAMRRVLDGVRREYGVIHGVIHAAGLAEGGLMAAKTPESVAGVMRAKVTGTLVLEELLRGDNLDVLVLCSSISTALGGLGLSDYAGANSFLDAFARSTELRALGTVVSSMKWDAWRDVGMATQHPLDPDAPAALRRRAEELLENAIAPAEGVEAFGRCLRRGLTEVVISTRDLSMLLERSRPAIHSTPGQAEAPAARPNAPESSALTLHRREGPAEVGLENEIERTIADIWQNLLGVDQIGATDDFFELGGHSLLATQVLSRLQLAFGLELSLRLLFEARTVRELAQRIHQVRAERAGAQDGEDPEREEIEL